MVGCDALRERKIWGLTGGDHRRCARTSPESLLKGRDNWFVLSPKHGHRNPRTCILRDDGGIAEIGHLGSQKIVW